MRHLVLCSMLLALCHLFVPSLADEFAFFDACEAGDAEAISAALEAGTVDVNYADENGYTPLILAAKSGHLDAIDSLLNGGADVELSAVSLPQILHPLAK